MKTLIIPDIHGKVDLLASMLNEHGDADRIIQLGDLANCVYQDRDGDLACLQIALEMGFEVLVGNHELPYFGGKAFSGFGFIPEVKEAVKALDWRVAAEVDGILITHAGLHPSLARSYDNAKTAAFQLNQLWSNSPTLLEFDYISPYRGGYDPYGGILWRDHQEKVSAKFPQIYGHSKGDRVRRHRTVSKAICIDCEKPYIIES